jgi:hypothetical protein
VWCVFIFFSSLSVLSYKCTYGGCVCCLRLPRKKKNNLGFYGRQKTPHGYYTRVGGCSLARIILFFQFLQRVQYCSKIEYVYVFCIPCLWSEEGVNFDFLHRFLQSDQASYYCLHEKNWRSEHFQNCSVLETCLWSMQMKLRMGTVNV